MVDTEDAELSIRRQCELLGVNRNRLQRREVDLDEEELALTRRLEELHLRFPEFGARRMSQWLLREGRPGVTLRRVGKVMKRTGLAAIYRRPRTSQPAPGAQIHPYLLRERTVDSPDEVWCADVTYIPMARGFAYLVAVMDWKTRAVLSWKLSNTLRWHVLRGGPSRGVDRRGQGSRDIQHRSGLPVHQSGWHSRIGFWPVRLATSIPIWCGSRHLASI